MKTNGYLVLGAVNHNLVVSAYSSDTITDCVRRGFTLDRCMRDGPTTFEVSARPKAM